MYAKVRPLILTMKTLFVLENTMDNLEGGTEVSSRHLAGLLRKREVQIEEWAPFNARKPIFWYTSIFGQIYILIVLLCKLVKNRVQILHVQGKYLIPPVVILGKLLKISTVATIRDYVVVCPIGLCLFHRGLNKGLSLRTQGESLKYSNHGFGFFLTKEIPRFLPIYHSKDSLMIRIIRYVFLIRGWLVSQWLKFWLRRADAVVAVSKYVQGVLSNYGIRSQVIYNSFDTKFLPKFSQQSTINNQQSTILFVGKPSYGKGYDLFRSLSLNKLFEKYRFLAIGGSSKLPYLETLQKIKEAAAVVVPSRWPEPFGRVALESLMMGTPAVVTNKGGLPEIVEDGVTGVLSEISAGSLAESLKKIIGANVRFRENIQSRRRQLIEKFVKIPAEKYMRLYLSLLS